MINKPFIILLNRAALDTLINTGQLKAKDRAIVFLKDENVIWTHDVVFGGDGPYLEKYAQKDDVVNYIDNINSKISEIKEWFKDVDDTLIDVQTSIARLPKLPDIDDAITNNSSNPVTSKAIYNALQGKISKDDIKTINGQSLLEDDITIPVTKVDNELLARSTNPVENRIVTTEFRNLYRQMTSIINDVANITTKINKINTDITGINEQVVYNEHSKGFFTSPQDLPIPAEDGDWAIVSEDGVWYVYTYSESLWNKGDTFDLPEINLNDYYTKDLVYTKEEVNELIPAQQIVDLSEIDDELDDINKDVATINSLLSDLKTTVEAYHNRYVTAINGLDFALSQIPIITVDAELKNSSNPVRNTAVYEALNDIKASKLDIQTFNEFRRNLDLSEYTKYADLQRLILDNYDDRYVLRSEVYTPNEWNNTLGNDASNPSSGEGGSDITVDSDFSLTSIHPLANFRITQRFFDVEHRISNLEDAMATGNTGNGISETLKNQITINAANIQSLQGDVDQLKNADPIDLGNYYTKNEVDAEISTITDRFASISRFSIQVVDDINNIIEPSSSTIYLLQDDEDPTIYIEYLYTSDKGWLSLGLQTFSVDFSDYYDKSKLYTKEEITNLFNSYYTKDKLYTQEQIDSKITRLNNDINSNISTQLNQYYTLDNLYTKDQLYTKSDLYTKTEIDEKFVKISLLYSPDEDLETPEKPDAPNTSSGGASGGSSINLDELKSYIDRILSSEQPKHKFLEEAEYEALTKYEDNTIYFIYEPQEEINTNWTFGGTFPITLSGTGVGVFPITLI